jgi:hypothetical protein
MIQDHQTGKLLDCKHGEKLTSNAKESRGKSKANLKIPFSFNQRRSGAVSKVEMDAQRRYGSITGPF